MIPVCKAVSVCNNHQPQISSRSELSSITVLFLSLSLHTALIVWSCKSKSRRESKKLSLYLKRLIFFSCIYKNDYPEYLFIKVTHFSEIHRGKTDFIPHWICAPLQKNEHFLMFGNFILRQRDTISTRIQKKMHYIKSINTFLCHPMKQVFKPQTKHDL